MPSSRRKWQVLAVVTAGAFLADLDLSIVNVAFLAIRADFSGASLADLSWVLSAYAIVFSALLVPAGRLADRPRRRRLFLAGLAVSLVGSVLCAAALGPWTLVGRIGPRPLALSGAALFAAGCGWWIWRAGATPAYATDLLPGIVVGGIGVSLVFPVLAGAAVAGLPPDRAATGSALFNMARQIGGVIGVAAALAILGDGALEAGDFRAPWAFMAAASVAAGIAALRIPARFAPRPAGEAPLRPTQEDAWETTSSNSGGTRPDTSPGCAPSTASSSATAPPAAGSSAAA